MEAINGSGMGLELMPFGRALAGRVMTPSFKGVFWA